MRAQVPPPNRLVSGQKYGWKKASPDRASRMKLMPTTQWLARSGAV